MSYESLVLIKLRKRLSIVWVAAWLMMISPEISLGQIDSTLVSNCAPSSTNRLLENGNIRARILNSSGIYINGNRPIFEVPIGYGNEAIAADALWLAGMVDGELRVAATTYGPNEFWSGPLPELDMPPVTCEPFDKIWILDRQSDFPSSDGFSISDAVSEWPTHLGAPYHEIDGTDGYSPSEGDLPKMLGDEMFWWIMNDRGNVHQRTKSNPIGVEIRASAFSFDVGHQFENSLFYRYQIVNRNSVPIQDAFVGRFVDVSFDSGDDYIGTDTTLSLVYVYNSDNEDTDSDQPAGGYGLAPPAFGFSIIEASHSGGGLPSDISADWGDYMTNSLNYSRGPEWTILRDTEHWYQQLQSVWSDGTPLTEGADGHESSQTLSRFAFPGDPVAGEFWSENNSDNSGGMQTPSSRWLLGSFGPFTLEPNETATFTFVYTWARGSDHLDSITQLKDLVRQLWLAKDQILSPPIPTSLKSAPGYERTIPTSEILLEGPFPNPSSGNATITIINTRSGNTFIKVYDLLARQLAEYPIGYLVAGSHQHHVDVSEYPSGIYYLGVYQNESVEFLKLIVQ